MSKKTQSDIGTISKKHPLESLAGKIAEKLIEISGEIFVNGMVRDEKKRN